MSDNRKDPKDECRALFESTKAPNRFNGCNDQWWFEQGFQAAYAMPRVGMVFDVAKELYDMLEWAKINHPVSGMYVLQMPVNLETFANKIIAALKNGE